MSKSYRKTPIAKSRTSLYRSFAKKYANKRVRQSSFVKSGKYYCKISQSCEIYDFISYYPLSDRIRDYNNECHFMHKRFQNEEEAIMDWKRSMYYK